MNGLAESSLVQPVFQRPVAHRDVTEGTVASAIGLSARAAELAPVTRRAVHGVLEQGPSSWFGLAGSAREGLRTRTAVLAPVPRTLLSSAALADAMSASITPESSVLLKRVEAAFERGEIEVFEYGVESQLARTISLLISEHGPAGLNAITTVLRTLLVGDEVGSEVLRRLGNIDDRLTLDGRIRFLAHQLETHPSPRRRYAAAVALADINEPDAIKALQTAVHQETVVELKQRFRRLLQLLGY